MCNERATKTISVEFLHFASLASTDGRGLVQQAIAVRDRAQAPYSHFKVGAALWSTQGGTFYGCNVECADYSGTTHAEQSAIAAMVTGGHKKIKMIVLAAAPEGVSFNLGGEPRLPGGFDVRSMLPPCGGCLQKIWENCHGDLSVPILSVTPDGGIFRTTIGDIFPISFNLV
jgi:cytidine deaminase